MATGSGADADYYPPTGFDRAVDYLDAWRKHAQAIPGEVPGPGYVQHAIDLYTAARLGAQALIDAIKADPALGADPRNEAAQSDLAILARIAWAYEQGAANFAQRRIDTARAATFAGVWERYVAYLTGELPERAAEAVKQAKQAIEDAGGGAGIGLVLGLGLALLLALGLSRRK